MPIKKSPQEKPRITLARESRRPLTRVEALKKLRLKPSDVLADHETDSEFIFVTKNGMKVKVQK